VPVPQGCDPPRRRRHRAVERARLAENTPQVQMIFQDPYDAEPALDRRRSIGQPMVIGRLERRMLSRRDRHPARWVGLPDDARQRYPHEFSGGSASASASRARSP